MKIWPGKVNDETFVTGFTSKQTEDLVSRKRGFLEGFPKVSPLAFWEAEIYSLGKTYREWLGWPWFIPLPMIGDHGVELHRSFSERERNSGARTYLTWSSWRSSRQFPGQMKVIQITHPWVVYRKSKSIEKCASASGTLVFIPHTTQETLRDEFDFENYFQSLESLPEKFKPFFLCLQMHDVRKGLHRELEKFGYPIFTLGNSSSPFFVDRFYDLVRRFDFCTSNVAGSQTFYCEEAGVPYFLHGYEGQELDESGLVQLAYAGSDSDLVDRVKRLFSISNIGGSAEKEVFLEEVLGLNVDPSSSRRVLRRRFFLDLIILSPFLARAIVSNALEALGSALNSSNAESRSKKIWIGHRPLF